MSPITEGVEVIGITKLVLNLSRHQKLIFLTEDECKQIQRRGIETPIWKTSLRAFCSKLLHFVIGIFVYVD